MELVKMNKRHSLSLHARFLKLVVLPAIAASLLFPEPLLAQTTTDQFNVVGTIVSYAATFNDGCRVGNVDVEVDSGVVRNPPSPTQTDLQTFVTISGQDNCHGGVVIGFFGSTSSGVQLSTQGSVNGTKAPQAATMSGQVPASDGSDTATFNLSLTASGLPFDVLDTNKVVNPISPTQVVITVTHSDGADVLAFGPLTISTQKLGTIPVSDGSGDMLGSRTSQVTITH
jgi:hypothetical protein